MMTTTLNQTYVEPVDLTAQLNQFFIENEKKAYTIANISLKNPDDALDVVQDVMIKFVEKYRNKEYKLWTPLFYRMIQNRITDIHRKNTKQKKIFMLFHREDESMIENIADENYVTTLKQIDNAVQIDNLQQALKTLPTRQLQAFICRIWEDLSVAETAKSMKCSQGSVKTHLFRALKHVRVEVQKNGK